MKALLVLFTGLLVIISSRTTFAKTDLLKTKKLILPVAISNDEDLRTLGNKVIPNSLTAADSSQTAVSKMIDHSLSYFWNNSNFKNTQVGKTATSLEQKLKMEAEIGEKNSPSKISHKITLRLLAMQTQARLEYKGWVNAALKYNAKVSTTEAELSENISKDKDLIISHIKNPEESKSQLSLRWNW